jgi:hypothetical protein
LPVRNPVASYVFQKIYELENYCDYILFSDGVCVPKLNNDIRILKEVIKEFKAIDMNGYEIDYFKLKINHLKV